MAVLHRNASAANASVEAELAPHEALEDLVAVVDRLAHVGLEIPSADPVEEALAAPLEPAQADGRRGVNSLSGQIYCRAVAENRRTIKRLMPPRPGSVMLDVGCADGIDTLHLASHIGATQAIGFELVDYFVEGASARGVDVRQVDITEPWPLDDCSVDVVHSNQVIEHLAETDHFMREIRRVLRPDGYAIVSTNNLASWHNVFALALGWQPLPCHVSDECVVGNPLALSESRYGERVHRHLRICTSRALAGLAEAHGLVVERAVGSGYYPFGVHLSRVLARLDGRHAAYLVQRYRRA
jgi:SAM-dependent methyltransferase